MTTPTPLTRSPIEAPQAVPPAPDAFLAYTTDGGIAVERSRRALDYATAVEPLLDALDQHAGRAAQLVLRVPRTVHALGHGLRRSAGDDRVAAGSR